MKVSVLLVFIAYYFVSKSIFNNVLSTTKVVIDEEFHLPLGERFCHFEFDEWDPKVTTLPGLYLISSIILGPWNLCTIYWLRLTSFLFSCINFFLVYKILLSIIKKQWGQWEIVLAVLSFNLLPPLYFYSHLYYTDVVSLSTNLLVILLCESGWHYFASIAGFLSVLCRQTNIVFVAIYAGKYILSELYGNWAKSRRIRVKNKGIAFNKLQLFIKDIVRTPLKTFSNLPNRFWLHVTCYFSLVIAFLCFLWLNGGIVVGDRSSHQMTINLPQIFYFSLFCLIFSWPYFLMEIFNFLNFTKRNKIRIIIFCLITILIIHFNTVVHPYLLADNRHFVFYVWNRFYGRYWWFKYSMMPVYIFALYVIIKTIWNKNNITLFLLYIPSVFILLVSQALLELRYFLVPFIIFKFILLSQKKSLLAGTAEILTYIAINYASFNVFFSKVIFWEDIDSPQRIIW